MPTRFLVTQKFHLTGRGATIIGRFLEGTRIKQGMILRDEVTGNPVEIRGIEIHTRQTREGTLYSFTLDEKGAQTVGPNSILVTSDLQPSDHQQSAQETPDPPTSDPTNLDPPTWDLPR